VLFSSAAVAVRIPALVALQQGVGLDGKSAGLVTYVNGAVKINDQWTFTPELRNDISWRADDVNKTSLAHVYFRVPVTQKDVANVGDWKLSLTYRYTPPTTNAAQLAGHLGQLAFRPTLSGKVGPLDVKALNTTYLWMNRREENKNVKILGGAPAKTGNSLVGNGFELIVSYEVWNGFQLYADDAVDFIYQGRKSHGAKRTWTNSFGQEYGISRDFAGGFSAAIAVDNLSKFGTGDDFKFWTKGTSNLTLNIAQVF